MEKKKNLLTKVAKGIAFGDVSNISVRNILTEISKEIKGVFTEQEMYDTLDYFNWRCPYTNKDLRPLIENNLGGYATDHIYPQNKEWCGLNVKGNLVIVTKEANSAKKGMDIVEFMETDSEFWSKLNIDKETRITNLNKIIEFQKKCEYDPEKIQKIVSPILKNRYDEIREKQQSCISDIKDKLKNEGIHTFIKETTTTSSISTAFEIKKSKEKVELVLNPENEDEFKRSLLSKKCARFLLTYETGVVKESIWKAESFDVTSNLKVNIKSRPFWRRRTQEGLVKVEVIVD